MKRSWQLVLHNGSNKLNMADFCMGGRTGWLNCYFPYLSSLLLGWGVRLTHSGLKSGGKCAIQGSNTLYFKRKLKGFFGFFASKGACGVKRKVFLTFDFSPGGTSIHIFVCTKFPFFSPLRQWVQVWVTDFAIQYFYGKSYSDRVVQTQRHFKGSVIYHIHFFEILTPKK